MAGPYFVSAASGNDGDSGLSEVDAFLTVNYALSVIAAVEKIWVKADGTYTESPDIVTAGGSTTEIVVEGYTTTTGDGGQATIVGTLTDSTATRIQYCFKNLVFDANSANNNSVSLASYEITWRNCVFKNGNADGCVVGSTTCFYECEFLDNTGDGFSNTTSGATTFVNCKFYRNGLSGIDSGGTTICYSCVFFSNGSNAIDGASQNERALVVINCTIDGDSKDTLIGVTKSSAFRGYVVVINTIIYDCITGIDSDYGDRSVLVHNLLNANTTDYIGDASDQEGGVTAAPDFVDEVAGADYSLNPTSPAKGAGTNYSSDEMDIGAVQLASGGGSGGLGLPNKRGGKQ